MASGCWAYVGQQGGEQVVNLTPPGCMEEEHITHEVLHSLGFYHEQNRPDRDQHVRILEENIRENKRGESEGQGLSCLQLSSSGNFIKQHTAGQYMSYDHFSIMHYPNTAFGMDNKTTIGMMKMYKCT